MRALIGRAKGPRGDRHPKPEDAGLAHVERLGDTILQQEQKIEAEIGRQLSDGEAEELLGENIGELEALGELEDPAFERTFGISREEFEPLVERCEPVLVPKGCGKVSSLPPRSELLLAIFIERTGWRQVPVAKELGLQRLNVTRVASRVVRRIQPVMKDMIAEVDPHKSARTFANYPEAIGALDVTEVPIQKPEKDQHLFYSAKKKIHHVKGEVAVTPDDRRTTHSASSRSVKATTTT
jgi:hypothetical protein